MKTNHLLIVVVLLASLLAGCNPQARVGELRTESQAVELKRGETVHTEIAFGAGVLDVSGGAKGLLEAGFTYNVAGLKPVVAYKDGVLAVRQPDLPGLPVLQGITGFRNEWKLRLHDATPMALKVDVGGGTSNLHLASLSLTRLDVSLGAGHGTLDLSGDWKRDLDVAVDTGAANVTVRLPGEVGVRVEVSTGPTVVNAPGLSKNGNVYTNAAYGVSEVTLHVNMDAGIGWINLEVEE